jgi:hypothetical protein
MQKWEYRIERTDTADPSRAAQLQNEMDFVGDLGWELVCCFDAAPNIRQFVFKRAK